MNRSICVLWSLIMLFIGSISPVRAQEIGSFQGAWEMDDADGLAFELDLFQDGDHLTGHHCGMTTDARRIDCSLAGEDGISIDGAIVGDVAKVRFTSAYSGEIGMAKLQIQGDTLLWEITAYPNGAYYLPDQAVLTRSQTPAEPAAPAADDERLKLLHELVSQELLQEHYAYPVRLDPQYTAFGDLNGDGIEDVAAILYAFDESIEQLDADVRWEDRFLAVGFGAPSGAVTLALAAQAIPCLNCGGAYGEPEIGLSIDDAALLLASYGGSNWRWEIMQAARYTEGVFSAITYTEHSSYTGNDTAFTFTIDFQNLQGSRAYNYADGPAGSAWLSHIPINHASHPLAIDGSLHESAWQSAPATIIREASGVIYKPEHWSGPSDLNVSVKALWNAEGLYLGLLVEDDAVVPVESWERILKGDHVEIWLDFADSLIHWNADGWPVRRKPDSHTLQIGVGLPEAGQEPVVRMLYPEQPEGASRTVAAAAITSTGYTVEIAIPSREFEAAVPDSDEWQWSAGAVFGLSIIVSDTDNPDARGQDSLLATSGVQWGNPYTFGVGALVETYAAPKFPVSEWPTRY